jgi:hypothetical protein
MRLVPQRPQAIMFLAPQQRNLNGNDTRAMHDDFRTFMAIARGALTIK